MTRRRIDVHQHVLPPGHVLFGSDWPFAPDVAVTWFTGQLDAWDGLDVAGHAAVDRANALAIFPRFTTPQEEGQ